MAYTKQVQKKASDTKVQVQIAREGDRIRASFDIDGDVHSCDVADHLAGDKLTAFKGALRRIVRGTLLADGYTEV